MTDDGSHIYGNLSYENLAGMTFQEPFQGQMWATPKYAKHEQAQDGSPDSSGSSSPQSRITGNRARASSLNSRLGQSRSTAHITQQQINKKRQRATAEQLAVLEEAFLMNPSPNAKMRMTISEQISMTERSVQIWFQNRRAKNKLLHKRSGPEDLMFQQAFFGGRPGLPERSYSIDQGLFSSYADSMHNSPQGPAQESLVTRINCRSLTIGNWRRVACTASDLVCYFAHNEAKFTYYINSGASGYMIQFPINSILQIDLKHLILPDSTEMGRAVISISSSPVFFMEIPATGGWKVCPDFTENQQATVDLNHAMIGSYEHLRQSFEELTSVYNTIPLIRSDEARTVSSSTTPLVFDTAESIPGIPTSQLSTPTGLDTKLRGEPDRFGPELAKFPNRSSHRRTRSRSAPIAIDLSFMNNYGNHGFPGYNQQNSRTDGSQQYSVDNHSMRPTGVEFSDGYCTPTTAATSNYQDPWYVPSYANTPLLGGDSSQLGSPMIPGSSQFDLNTSAAHADLFGAFPGLSNHITPMNLLPAHALTETTRLDSVPEIPLATEQQFLPHANDHSTMPQAMDIMQANFESNGNDELHDLGITAQDVRQH